MGARYGTLGVGGTMGLALYMIVLMGAIMGANVGYMADSPQDATVHYNGSHVTNGATGETDNISLNVSDIEDGQERLYGIDLGDGFNIDYPGKATVKDATRGMARNMGKAAFIVGFGVADVTASVVYHLQWIPQWLVSFLFNLMAFLPVLGVGYVAVRKVSEVR